MGLTADKELRRSNVEEEDHHTRNSSTLIMPDTRTASCQRIIIRTTRIVIIIIITIRIVIIIIKIIRIVLIIINSTHVFHTN